MPDNPSDTGRMRNRITLQLRSLPAPGPAGDDVPIWSDLGTYYAEVLPLSGRMLFLARQALSTSDFTVKLRNLRPIDVFTHRFVYRGTVLGIDSVNRDDNRDEFYVILCTQLRGQVP